MPDWSRFDEMWKKEEPVHRAMGPPEASGHHTVFEDCLNYPIPR